MDLRSIISHRPAQPQAEPREFSVATLYLRGNEQHLAIRKTSGYRP